MTTQLCVPLGNYEVISGRYQLLKQSCLYMVEDNVALSIFAPTSMKSLNLDPWVRKIPWRRKSQPTPVFLPGKSHGQRSFHGVTMNRTRLSRHILYLLRCQALCCLNPGDANSSKSMVNSPTTLQNQQESQNRPET